jgi:SHS2 domain-containing protein
MRLSPFPVEVLGHPADIGFRAFGDTLPEPFARSALAMLSIAADPAAVLSKEEYPLAVESGAAACGWRKCTWISDNEDL